MRRALAALAATTALSPSSSLAQPATEVACSGCVVLAPASPPPGPMPLLVVLHGDEGSPSRLVSAWKSTASEAGVVLFAPRCPKEEGCAGSWWQWRGDPAWLERQVEVVERGLRIDPSRRYLAGWSGGATYLGLFAPRWFPRFAAISLAGGGAPPAERATCAGALRDAGRACAPVHYLMGDRNPLFSLAVSTRDYFGACGHDVTWELLPGSDHGGEWRAYSTRTRAILSWMLSHPEGCGPPADGGAPDSGPEAAATEPPDASTTTQPPALPPQPAPGSRCSCEAPGAPLDVSGDPWILAIATIPVPARARRWFRARPCGRSSSRTCT